MTNMVQITTAAPDKKTASLLAEQLVLNNVAACVQIVPGITSIYWWNDKIEESQEILCVIKTREDLYKKAEEIIKNNHPYDVPEITASKITHISKEYHKWMLQYTTAG